MKTRFTLIVVMAVGLLVAACRPAPTQTPGTPEPTTAPTDTPVVEPTIEPPVGMPPAPGQSEWTLIEIPEEGLTFEIPAGWLRPGDAWTWTPEGSERLLVGVAWADVPPGSEVEPVMFPAPAVVQSMEVIDLGWTSANRYTVLVFAEETQDGTPERYETHVLIMRPQGETRRAVDLFASAPSPDELTSLHTVLDHMLATLQIAE